MAEHAGGAELGMWLVGGSVRLHAGAGGEPDADHQ